MNYAEFEQWVGKMERLCIEVMDLIEDVTGGADEEYEFIMIESVLMTVFDTQCIKYGKDPVKEKKIIAGIGEDVEREVRRAMAREE